MAEKKKDKQGYQLQLNFDVETVRKDEKVDASPVLVEAALMQEFVKAEKNLEWLGFFTPSTSKGIMKKSDEKVISIITTVEGKKVKASATILPSAKYGLPDTADLDKYRAFQKILSDELIRNGKVPKHITFTSTELIKAMGRTKDGKLYKEVKDWLMKMISTTISSESAVWLADKKVWASDTFHIFERAVAYGQELEDGTLADCHHIWLSDWMLENINGLYLLSIDYDLHKQLRKPIAKSLLPVLQIGFYASGGTYTKRYDNLCQHLGIKNRKRFSHIKQQLDPSFEELQDKGFLAKWRYAENKLHKTYNIAWKAGDRFYEAQELLQEREKMLTEPDVGKKPKRITRKDDVQMACHQTNSHILPKPKQDKAQEKDVTSNILPEVKAEAVPEAKPEETTKADFEAKETPKTEVKSEKPTEAKLVAKPPEQPEPEQTSEEAGLVGKLVKLNVSKGVAEDLVKRFDNEFVEKWTEAIHYADAKDRAAFLVRAIQENWLVPEKYLVAKEREEATKRYEEQRQREREETERKMQEQKAEAERLDGIYNSLSLEQKEEVDKEAEERLPNLVKAKIAEGETDSPMVEGTLLVKKREVVKEWTEAGKIKVDDS